MLLWIVATLVAFYIKGLCGFANTLVFTSILGFGANNVNISPVELILGFPTNIILTWRNRKQLQTRVWLPLAALVLAGSIPGALMLKHVDARAIKIVFGVVVILVGLEMLLRAYKPKKANDSQDSIRGSNPNAQHRPKGQTIVLGIIGLLSGVLCGLFGVGALLAAYVGRVTESTDEFKANMAAVFIVDNTFRVILYSILGVITLSGLKQSLIMMPFMLIGLFAGIKSSEHMDDTFVKRIVIILLIISGIVLVAKNI